MLFSENWISWDPMKMVFFRETVLPGIWEDEFPDKGLTFYWEIRFPGFQDPEKYRLHVNSRNSVFHEISSSRDYWDNRLHGIYHSMW